MKSKFRLFDPLNTCWCAAWQSTNHALPHLPSESLLKLAFILDIHHHGKSRSAWGRSCLLQWVGLKDIVVCRIFIRWQTGIRVNILPTNISRQRRHIPVKRSEIRTLLCWLSAEYFSVEPSSTKYFYIHSSILSKQVVIAKPVYSPVRLKTISFHLVNKLKHQLTAMCSPQYHVATSKVKQYWH